MAEQSSTSSFLNRQLASLRASRTTLSFALILGVIALGSRLWAIADKSLWLDEALSWRAARMPLTQMLDWTSTDKHPPLYYTTLHFWVNALGDSEFALRSLSAVAGAATVMLLAAAGKRMQGSLLAAVAAVFLLLNSTQLYFSQEVRMYALMGLLSLSASLALGELVTRPSIFRTGLYTVLLVSVVYTHYSGFIVAAAHALVFAGYGTVALWRRRRPEVLIAGLAAFSLTALVYIPWLSNFRATAQVGDPTVPEPSYDLMVHSFKGAFGLGRADDLWLVPTLVILGVGVLGIARRWRDPVPVSLGALALVPLGQLLISYQSKPVFDLRQISPYVPALVSVLALGFVDALGLIGRINLPGRLAGAAVTMALAGALLGFMFKGFAATYTAPPLEDWRAAAADLRDFNGSIYITAVYMLVPFSYYYGNQPNVHSFGVWSPETESVGETEMIGISHQSEQSVLTALGSNVNIEGHRVYPGVTFLEVRTLHHTAMNVDVPVDQAGAEWSVNAEGYLETTSGFSSFTCKCTLDANGDGLADESFTMIIGYLDTGRGQFQVFGTSSATVLASETLANTGAWRTLNADVPAGTPVGTTFGLSRGVVLGRLQVVRTDLQNADVFGSYQGTTRWILGSDGYVQSADGLSYIDSTIPLDADKDGQIDQAFVLELEYRGGESGSLQVSGLQSGDKWVPIPQDVHVLQNDGGWRTVDVRVAKGARLRTSFYIGKGVVLRAVRFLSAAG